MRDEDKWKLLITELLQDVQQGRIYIEEWTERAIQLSLCENVRDCLEAAFSAAFPDTRGEPWEETIELAARELGILKDERPSPVLHMARLTYYKGTGKFYSNGELEVLPEERGPGWYQIFERVDTLLEPQRLPGLSDHSERSSFIVEIRPPEGVDYGYPALTNIEYAVKAWSR
jgi:hypothetical protein